MSYLIGFIIFVVLLFIWWGIIYPFFMWIEDVLNRLLHPQQYKRQKEIKKFKTRLSTIQKRKPYVKWFSYGEGILEDSRKEMEALHREEREIRERLSELSNRHEAI